MTSPDQLRPQRVHRPGLELRCVEVPCPEFNWFLHQAVGAPFCWGGREDWGRAEWTTYVNRPELETWVAWMRGSPAGYFEMEKLPDHSAHIHCIGLLEPYFGQHLGAWLLTEAVERAWAAGANRVWLSTCSHDHPHALPNYLDRGFRIVEERDGPPNWPRRSALFAPPQFD